MKRLTTQEFIEKAKSIHGDKYDYSKAIYTTAKKKLIIICPIHGEFEQTPDGHLRGQGCPKCKFEKLSNDRRLTINEFIEKAREIHGDKYDYSNTVYVNSNTKLEILCPEHGYFSMLPFNHLSGKGCPKCGILKLKESRSLTNEEFIKKAKEVHGDKYDYSITQYTGIENPISFICPEHGIITQIANIHLHTKIGCPSCAGNKKLTTEEFIQRSIKVHGNKYDYSKVNYVNYNTKVTIICPEHGEFQQTPQEHLRGSGCPKCNQSKGEVLVENILKELKLPYKTQVPIYHKFFSQAKVVVDFIVKFNNIPYIIEYNGIQHYIPVEHFGGLIKFEKQQLRDNQLRAFCEKYKVPLIEIKYSEDPNELKNKLFSLFTKTV